MNKIRTAFVGCGGIATYTHLPSLADMSDVEIVAICDINPVKMDVFEEKMGYAVKKYTDYRQMLQEVKPDVVHVCTPNYLHSEITVAALLSGANVLCEKPDAMTVKEAEAMKEARDKSGKTLMVMRNNRFLDAADVVRSLIAEGKTGELYTGRCGWIRRRGIPGAGGWFTTKAQSGGGPLIDLGVHFLDLAIHFMGSPKPIAVSGCTYRKFQDCKISDSVHSSFGEKKEGGTFDVEDLAIGFIRFADGRSLQLEFSWASNIAEEKNFVELRGEKLGFTICNDQLSLYGEQSGKLTDTLVRVGANRGHYRYIHHFYDVAYRGEKPIYDISEGIEMIRILNGMYKSAELGHEILV
jgi:predicted dehydrogenase